MKITRDYYKMVRSKCEDVISLEQCRYNIS